MNIGFSKFTENLYTITTTVELFQYRCDVIWGKRKEKTKDASVATEAEVFVSFIF